MPRIFHDADINLQILIRANPEENLGKVWAVRAILDNIFHQAIEELLQAASVEQIALFSRVIQFLNDRLEDMPNKGSATALANALQIAVEGLSAPVPQLPGHPQEPVGESAQMATEEVISQGLLADLAEAQEDADGIIRRIPDEIKEARSLRAQVRTETEKIRGILRSGGSIEPGPYQFDPESGSIHREPDQQEERANLERLATSQKTIPQHRLADLYGWQKEESFFKREAEDGNAQTAELLDSGWLIEDGPYTFNPETRRVEQTFAQQG